MTKKFLGILTVLGIAAMMLIACDTNDSSDDNNSNSSKTEYSLVGEWEWKQDSASIGFEITSDNKFIGKIKSGDDAIEHEYTIKSLSNNTITVTEPDNFIPASGMKYQNLSSNSIEISGFTNSENWITFTRIK